MESAAFKLLLALAEGTCAVGMPPPGVHAKTHHSPYFEGDFMILVLCCCQRKVNCSSWLLGKGCTSARAACAWHRLRLVPASTVGCRQMYAQKHSSTHMHPPHTELPQHSTRGDARPAGLRAAPFPFSFLRFPGLCLPLSQHPFVSLSVWVQSLTVFFLGFLISPPWTLFLFLPVSLGILMSDSRGTLCSGLILSESLFCSLFV